MFFINYDLAKQIVNERRAKAMAESARRASRDNTASPKTERGDTQADVIELTFAPDCEQEKIGA
jgi:hypothetical protein